MGKKYVILISLAFLSSFFAYAQQDKIDKANKEYEKYAFIDAQKIYLKVASKGYRSQELFQKLGNSFYFNSDYKNAAKWYNELMKDHANEVDPEYYFRYAQSLKANKEYDESNKFMSKFFDSKKNTFASKKNKTEINFLDEIKQQSGRYKIKNIKANSSYADFGPAYYGNRVVFTSSRDTGVFNKRIHDWNNQPFLDLYNSKIDENTGELTGIAKFDSKLNTRYHESTPAFTNNLKTIYFTRNNYNEGNYGEASDGTNKLKIYKAILNENGTWSKAKSINVNNDEYSVSHPALSTDNTKLYFVSDMPGGYGNTDLYVSTIAEDGTLGTPKNLGPKINTAGRESFPFVSEKDDLYFASNGHLGLGGLDIFVVKFDNNNKIKKIYNLGEPVNSSQDDFAYIVRESKNTGYFSSNRNGGVGDDDIYSFLQLEDIREKCDILLRGTITDKDSGTNLSGAKVTLYDTKNEILNSVVVDSIGEFTFTIECNKDYFIRGEMIDYTSVEKLVTTPKKSDTITVNLQLNKNIKTATIGKDLGKILDLKPIYFSFNKFTIRKDAKTDLAKVIEVMNEYPSMKIDIRSHTDSIGDDDYNMELSEKRTEAAINYLVEKGSINRDRLTGKGYGETQLINNCDNNSKCSAEKHQLNRRSEFIILGY